MPFKIKARVMALGRYQNQLIPELAKRGIKTNPSELSQALKGTNQQKKMLDILSAANEIVSEWERTGTS